MFNTPSTFKKHLQARLGNTPDLGHRIAAQVGFAPTWGKMTIVRLCMVYLATVHPITAEKAIRELSIIDKQEHTDEK